MTQAAPSAPPELIRLLTEPSAVAHLVRQVISRISITSVITKVGTYSFPGSTSCSLRINKNVANGGLFAIQGQSEFSYVSAFYRSPAVMGLGSPFDTNQQFQYNSSTLQIHHPQSGLCLDDGGNEVQGMNSLSAVLSFTTCDSASINQQFVFTTDDHIFNPNWPNYQVCLYGSGNTYYGTLELILWRCSTSDTNQLFNIVLICPPGIVINQR